MVRFGSVWFWLVTVLLIVCPRSLLLCPFHKKLRIWWKKSFGFCETDNPQSSFMMYCYSTDLNVYTWVELTSQNLQVFCSQFLRNPQYHDKYHVTAQGGASNWNPDRKRYQPDWRCNIHSYLQTRLIHLCVEVYAYTSRISGLLHKIAVPISKVICQKKMSVNILHI